MTRLNTKSVSLTLVGLLGLAASLSAFAAPTHSSHSKKTPIKKVSFKKKHKKKGVSTAEFSSTAGSKEKALPVSAISKSDSSVTSGNAALPQSVAETQASTAAKKKLPVSLIDVSMFYGPSVTDITSAATPDDSIGATTGIWSRHQMMGIYSVAKDWRLIPVFDFNYQFTDPNTGGKARGFKLNDPNLRVQKVNILKGTIGTTELALDGDVRYYIPASKSSRTNNSFGSGRLTLSPSATFGKSGFSFAMTNYIRAWGYQTSGKELDDGTVVPYRTLQIYSGPQLNYSINDNIQPFVLFEVSNNWYADGRPELTDEHDPKHSLADLEPGVNFQLNDRISLSPYLNWFTNQHIRTTSANLTAVIQLF